MSRSVLALRWTAGGVLVAGWLAWWAPTLLLAVARWQGGRLRFVAVMGLGRTLVALGWPEVASELYAAEMVRAERELRALRAGRCSLVR